jgi:hypothetical protein
VVALLQTFFLSINECLSHFLHKVKIKCRIDDTSVIKIYYLRIVIGFIHDCINEKGSRVRVRHYTRSCILIEFYNSVL